MHSGGATEFVPFVTNVSNPLYARQARSATPNTHIEAIDRPALATERQSCAPEALSHLENQWGGIPSRPGVSVLLRPRELLSVCSHA